MSRVRKFGDESSDDTEGSRKTGLRIEVGTRKPSDIIDQHGIRERVEL